MLLFSVPFCRGDFLLYFGALMSDNDYNYESLARSVLRYSDKTFNNELVARIIPKNACEIPYTDINALQVIYEERNKNHLILK